MAKKTWTVTTDEGTYSVELKGAKLSINGGDMQKLRTFARKTHFADVEYTIPLGNRSATLFMQSMMSPVLAYDGRDCATGEPWEYQKMPVWGIVFLVLDIVMMFVAGWLWGLLAFLVTAVVVRTKMNMVAKIILSVLMLVAAFAGGTIMALLLQPVI